jgi:Domain of unknown function (DUF4397)
MTVRASSVAGMLALTLIATGCDRTETSSAPVTSTSPAGSSTAPSSESAKSRDEALMRAVQAVPTSNNLDLFAGDLLLFDGLAFKAVTPYRAIDGQRYAFGLRPAGMTRAKPLSMNSEEVRDGEFYTAFAMPQEGGGTQLKLVNDPHDPPGGGKARLRVVHAGVDAGTIDLRVSGSSDTLFTDVEYLAISEYRDIAPMNGAVQVVGDTDKAPVLANVNLHIEPDRFYTVVVVGNARTSSLEAFLIEDSLAPQVP